MANGADRVWGSDQMRRLPYIPRESVHATTLRYIGWCPVCQRDIKVRSGVLVHHGYQRPGVGYIIGDCPGVGHEPYETGTGACEYYLKGVRQTVARTEHNLQILTRPEGPPSLVFEHYDAETRRYIRDPRTREIETIRLTRAQVDDLTTKLPTYDRDHYNWERTLRIAIANTESALKFWGDEKRRIEGLIQTWAPQPLRTIEQETERREQSRAEREAAKQAERNRKISDEVAKIQKRIDAAVRNKNSATLADIYTSTKLVQVSGYRMTDVQALDLLNRDGVWRAFGLLTPEGYVDPKEARELLHDMTYGRRVPSTSGGRFDYAPMPWPPELGGGTAKTQIGIKMTDRSTNPNVVEYAIQTMIKRGKNPNAAAKDTVKKHNGTENVFFGPGITSIDTATLENALWNRLVDFTIIGMGRIKEGKEHFALDGTLQHFNQNRSIRAELKSRVIEKLGRDPFTNDDTPPLKESTMASRRKSNSAEAAGEQYAQDQINSEYFSDWVRDQLREASKMPQDQVLPLNTKVDALVIAGKMLQQLEWDTRREYRPEVDPKAFFVGFHKACQDARPWLAEELLTVKGEMGLREGRSVSEHVDPALIEAFAADVDALREAKGITTDQAFDLITKPAWFRSYRGQRPEDKIDLENRIINKAKSIGRARSRVSRETPRVASRKSPKAKRSATRRRRGKDGRFR